MRLFNRLLDRLMAAGATHSDVFEIGPHGPRRRKYTSDQLRAIRAEKGVGRPHMRGEHRYDPHIDARIRQMVHANQMAFGARCYGGQRGSEFLKPYDGA